MSCSTRIFHCSTDTLTAPARSPEASSSKVEAWFVAPPSPFRVPHTILDPNPTSPPALETVAHARVMGMMATLESANAFDCDSVEPTLQFGAHATVRPSETKAFSPVSTYASDVCAR